MHVLEETRNHPDERPLKGLEIGQGLSVAMAAEEPEAGMNVLEVMAPHGPDNEEEKDEGEGVEDSVEEEQETGDDNGEDGVVDGWLEAIAAVAPDDAFEDDDFSVNGMPQLDDDEDLDPEFCCEQQWTDPPALPPKNIAAYPQEDKAYFKTKEETNYVRNDRVSLGSLHTIMKNLEQAGFRVPTMRSVYEDNVPVEMVGWGN